MRKPECLNSASVVSLDPVVGRTLYSELKSLIGAASFCIIGGYSRPMPWVSERAFPSSRVRKEMGYQISRKCKRIKSQVVKL